jgi:hypothetical protein
MCPVTLAHRWHSLARFSCKYVHTARLHDANPEWLTEQFGWSPPPNPYANAAAAEADLRTHPLHRWMTSQLPQIMKCAPAQQMRALGYVMDVLSHLIAACAEPRARPVPPYEVRNSAANRITKIQQDISTGIVPVPRAKRALLLQLLADP